MAGDKKSFVVYHDINEVLIKLTDEQVGKLFRAMVNHSMGAPEVELDELVLEIAFMPIKQQMDRDADKWDDIREKRIEAGRKGGLKSAEVKREANQANATFASKCLKQNQANQAVNVTVTDTVNVNATDTVTTTDTVTVPDGDGGSSSCDDKFNIWKKLTPDDIDAIYDKFPNSGGFLIDKVYEDVKTKRKEVKNGLKYIMGYAKNVGWEEE